MKVTILTLCFFIVCTTVANAGALYKCIDRDGNMTITDNLQDGVKNCVLLQADESSSPQEQLPAPEAPPDADYDEGYVDAPIVYGQPIYFTPPIIVLYPYDYFTYEIAGAYIDIVFWKNGHRVHSEHWYEHGQRVSAADISSNRIHYRISAAELAKHREMSRRHYNLSNSGSHDESKSISKQQMLRRPRQITQSPQLVQKLPQQTQTKKRSVGGQIKTQQGKSREAPQQIK
jgi:hypothetical protein